MSRKIWLVIVCGGLIVSLSLGVRASGGLFVKPISLDLGLGREVIGLAIALQNLLWGAASPFIGAIADKFGAGKTSAVGAVIYALGLAILSQAGGALDIVAANVLMGVGMTGAGLSVVLGVAGKVAPPEKRSMVLGLVSAAGSFGQFVVLPFTAAMMDGFSWQWALVALAALTLLAVPLSLGIRSPPAASVIGASQKLGSALGEAFGHRGFWLLTAGFFVCGFHVVFVGVHLPGYLAENSLPTWLAAWALGLIGLFNIIGSFACGWLGQRFQKKSVLAWLYLARAAIFLLFFVVPLSIASVLIFAAALGLLWLGTVPLTSGLVAHIFGPAYMSMLYGIVFFSHQIGSFLAAWLGGLAFDRFGSYDAMWWISVALGVMAALLHWPIAEKPVARLAAASRA